LTTNFVGHCSQNPYDFGNTVRASLVGGQAPAITELMSSAWASLAKTGAKNGICFCVFPMFVPSLSWQNDRLYI
jgi:hypothetical protein